MRLASEDAGEHLRGRTCPRETYRYGVYTSYRNGVSVPVGWLNTRLTYGCVEQRESCRLTRARLPRLPVPFGPPRAPLLCRRSRSERDCIYQNNPTDSRMSRFSERCMARERFMRQKESMELFREIGRKAFGTERIRVKIGKFGLPRSTRAGARDKYTKLKMFGGGISTTRRR